MKVLFGYFFIECNAAVEKLCGIDGFTYKYGDELIDAMHTRDLFEDAGIEIIPSLYAIGHSQGKMKREAFEYICNGITSAVRDHLDEIDGIFLFLHGASSVVGLPGESGEHQILREIRNIVGPFLPIAVVGDPHGNITEEYTNMVNLLSCYRHSPHTDIRETYRLVARLLIDLLNNRRNIHPVYERVPIILGGERCISTEEPLRSINQLLDEVEQSDKILRACYHIGYCRQDSYLACAAVSVTPSDEQYTEYARKEAKRIAEFAFSKRKEFHFTGNALEPEEAIQAAMDFKGKPVFITDSGDNTSAGAPGQNTLVLKQFLDLEDDQGKKVLIAAITDPSCANQLLKYELGEQVSFAVGTNLDELSRSVELTGVIKAKGQVNQNRNGAKNVGKVVTVRLSDHLDLAVSTSYLPYTEIQQFEAANLDINEYDVIVVKLGYLFPELNEIAKTHIMTLTPGATYQYTERLPRKRVFRPIYPIDNI